MDDQRRSQPDDKRPREEAEGVRIIGPDEAAEAIERGDVAPRRADDEPRYGDRPTPPPTGPRPALRFPLDASADPTRIERPPVQPPPDPVTGPVELPHWTEPPTGEVPAVLIGDDAPLLDDDGDDIDAWSSFATSTPRWRDADDDWGDDGFMEKLADDGDEVRMGALGDQDSEPRHDAYYGFEDLEERVEERTGEAARPRFDDEVDDDWSASTEDEPPAAEPTAAVDDDWEADEVWTDDDEDVDPDPVPVGGGYDAPPPSGTGWQDPGGGERDITTAVGVGVGLAVVGAVALIISPAAAMVLVIAALGVAAAEYFAVLRNVGWEAATLVGITACAALPWAAYWRGALAYPLVLFLVVAAVLGWYLVGAGGRDPRVLEGSGATLLGVTWIGALGGTAALILRAPDGRALFLTAVLATVAYDVGGLAIGRSMGHRALTPASPNKTVEGLVGGMGAALVVTIVTVGIVQIGPWNGAGAALVLGLGAALAAPLGDLCQSLLKRDLGVKDMSGFLPGHGGVLDRIDGMLFVMPTVLWLVVAFGPAG